MGTEPDHGEESYRGSDRLKGKKAVTTGRDSGIGRAVAIAFAREGAYVLIVHLDSEKQDAATTLKLLEESGHNAVALAADVQDEQACQTIIDRAVQDLGGIDVLVSNAAYQMAQPGGIADITTEQFDRVMKTNVWAPSGWSRRRWSTCPRAGHHHHQLDPGGHAVTGANRLRDDQGSAGQPDQEPGPGRGAEGRPGQCRRAGPDLDSADPGHHAAGHCRALRAEHPARACRSAGRAGTRLVFLASQESSYVRGAVLPVTGGQPF